ncbi:MAG: pyridoxamine 5'-phosphate oxidase family protein [Clostridiales bacterium]|nr:pyridoxamine 5'-phosphate oxidase family protein [Clostridiales bacterium]
MRRKDREITDKASQLDIVRSCVVCRLGMSVNNRPYVVPLNFGYTWEENEPLRLYFHCAHQGMKLDMLAENNLVCFEMDGGHKLIAKEKLCEYSFAYVSVIGWGRAHFITEATEKHYALHKLMEHQAGPGEYNFSEAEMSTASVFCVEAEELTGKRNNA